MAIQNLLFPADDRADDPAAHVATARLARAAVDAAPLDDALRALADGFDARWPGRWHLGTSSWHFPGWAGLVWDRRHPAATLSREGLAAYAAHPLMRCTSLDRSFYRALAAAEYRRLADQVPPGFRFVVKAPATLTDASLRDPATGAPRADNPGFLEPAHALADVVEPLREGLGPTLGVLVLQISPLPARWLGDPPAWRARLARLLGVMVPALPASAILALELRDAELLEPALAELLREHHVRPCLGLHDRMPPAQAQLPFLRAAWPGDLVCRWNLQRGQRYAQARDRWAPFDRLQSEDLPTREVLARVMRGTLDAGYRAFVTINNKAEGCAPASVAALARELARS
jgi:uncharacterized protein YecE (DUF72 family)